MKRDEGPGSSGDVRDLSRRLEGRALERGETGYESARIGAVWNGRKPGRYPEVIVQAAAVSDVVAAVTFARDRDMKVGIRSGGHSWSASFLREGGMLLDVGGLKHLEIFPEESRAVAGPGIWGSRLNAELAVHGLFFPGGHCEDVALGGYLLQGGFGYLSRQLGLACASVTGMDVVTAAGERLHLDPRENSDLFWAARGSGAGFFAVVTSYELAVRPLPPVLLFSRHEYAMAELDGLFRWTAKLAGSMPPRSEFTLSIIGPAHEGGEPSLAISAFTMAFSEEEARADLAFMSACPLRSRALSVAENVRSNLERERAEEASLYPAGMRFAMDNACTNADADALIPIVREIVDLMPKAPAHVLWLPWGKTPQPEDMAFSMEADLFINACAIWTDPADDARHQAWATESMRRLEGVSSGTRLSDENLFDRPFRFMEESKLRRVEAIRHKYDPDRLFHCVWAT